MEHFELHSEFKPTGDQPQAIDALADGFARGNKFETLLGVDPCGPDLQRDEGIFFFFRRGIFCVLL